MTTTARRCAGCSGPLPELEDGSNEVKCGFCGLVNAVAAAPAGFTIQIDTRRVQPPTNALKLAGALGIFGMVLGVMGAAAGVIIAVRAISSSGGSTRTISRALNSGDLFRRNIAPADLSTVVSGGWRTVEVAAPPSGWTTFEPVGALAWAQRIATAWQPDAQLTRIDVAKLKADGHVDASGGEDSSAGYRFRSVGQEQAWRQAVANGDREPAIGHELMLKVVSGQVRALVSSGRPITDEPKPSPVDGVALATLLTNAGGKRGFATMPFYDGYMIFNDREGWVWYLTGLGNAQSFPRVRARDGAVYPYR